MRKVVPIILTCLFGAPAGATPHKADTPYSFTIPEAWRDVSDPDVIAYESPDRSQQLTVGEYVLKKKLSQAELRALVERFLETRRQAELEWSRGDATVGGASYLVESSLIKAEFWGSRQSSRLHFATIVWATPNRIVSWRFEAIDAAVLRKTVAQLKPTIKVK
ncbi:MAG TPA: hypothetical protein VGO61_05110 [Steroidobacteraceae bacterium]|jgi:hypothetical protein|nr:hypothetical protein [Steroidobacteraceae bacterium]